MKTKHLNFNITIFVALLISLCLCLCGCAEVNFVTYHNSDGSIQEYVFIAIDEQTLINNGYNPNTVKAQIKSDCYIEASNLLDDYRNKLLLQYQQQQISNSKYTILYDGIKIIEQPWEDNEYVIGLQFDNLTIYKKYYNLLNGSTLGNNSKEVKKLFYTKTYYYGTANYGDYSIFNRIYNYYSSTVFHSISPQQTNLTYSYSVSTRRFHSDADSVNMDTNGNYIHTWKIDPNEPGRKIMFYTISANRGMWIASATAVGLLVCLVIGIIGLIEYLKNKNNLND